MLEPTEIEFLSIERDSLKILADKLNIVGSLPVRLPFSDLAIEYVASVSKSILTNDWFRDYPEVLAVANWFKRSRLLELKKRFSESTPTEVLYTSRGLVFHIPPSNVDTIFIYSWFISLLCGNCNVVRLSNRISPVIVKCFEVISAVSKTHEFKPIRKANFFVRYEHEFEITSLISEFALCRVVWGGDDTVKKIRAIPLNPLATEICFPDRFSFSVIDALSFISLNTLGKQRLVKDFLNDAFWFSQLACSSPKAIFWIGQQDADLAQEEFWSLLQDQLRESDFKDGPPEIARRIEALFNFASEPLGIRLADKINSFPLVVESEKFSSSLRQIHSGRGLFLEMKVDSLAELSPLLSSKDQTISYFGISKTRWVDFISELRPRAGDRIVPIGKSLEFNTFWDGTDLIFQFCRAVSIVGN
jgi:hypothetical protein